MKNNDNQQKYRRSGRKSVYTEKKDARQSRDAVLVPVSFAMLFLYTVVILITIGGLLTAFSFFVGATLIILASIMATISVFKDTFNFKYRLAMVICGPSLGLLNMINGLVGSTSWLLVIDMVILAILFSINDHLSKINCDDYFDAN